MLGELVLNIEVVLHDVVTFGVRVKIRLPQLILRGTDGRVGIVGKSANRYGGCNPDLEIGSREGFEKLDLIRQRQNIEEPEASPHCGCSFREGLPRKTKPWLEVLQRRVAEERTTEMRRRIGQTSESGEMIVRFSRNGRQLVAQTCIDVQVRPYAPVITDVHAIDALPKSSFCQRARNGCGEREWGIGEEVCQAVECEDTIEVGRGGAVISNALCRDPELDGVQSFGQEGVVITLERGPMEV